MPESSLQVGSSAPISGAVQGNVRVLLRLEGVAVATVTVLLYTRSGASWWLFAALWLVPDISMVGYLLRPCRAARIYNAAHTYIVPVTLAVIAIVTSRMSLLPYALIWINHIGVDRALGFGFKYPEGFSSTHLGVHASKRESNAQAG